MKQRIEAEAEILARSADIFSYKGKSETLLNFRLDTAKARIFPHAPTLWMAIDTCVVNPKRAKVNTKKQCGDAAVAFIIAQCIKHRSNKASLFQYQMGCGLLAQGSSKRV